MDKNIINKLTEYFISAGKTSGVKGQGDAVTDDSLFQSIDTSSSGSVLRALTGSVSVLEDYHFPADLIGGCCPRVVGNEPDIVWNAAAEASDTERQHVVWHAKGDKIWYLAVRSSDMSSHPNTWCPFASLLPGMKDAANPPVIYTYYSDESATMMTVLEDGLQIHRGTTSVIRAKAERMSREMNNAPVVEMVPDRIERLSPVAWYSLSLFEERSRRILAVVSVGGALLVSILALLIWFFAAMSAISSSANVREIQERTETKSLQLLKTAQEQRASPMREQLARFVDINDGLLSLNGYLEIYQIARNKAEWRAVVPENVTSDRISDLGGKTLDTGPQGVIIGSSKEAQSLGKAQERR